MILDLSSGRRAVWWEKSWPDAIYIDIRPAMKPDVVCDSRMLPFRDKSFSLIIFDPPHECVSGNSGARYGHYPREYIRELVRETAKEAHRVAKDDAFMAFKWNTHAYPFDKIFGMMFTYWRILFGHTVASRLGEPHKGQRGGTHTAWAMLCKAPS
jgi:hypothetical protein